MKGTPGQLSALDALCLELGDVSAAAKSLHIPEGRFRGRLKRLRERTGLSTSALMLERDRELRRAA